MCLSVVPSLCLLSGVSGNWIEIAYGTSSGAVRVIVQHPETVGSGPQLFQTFTVHRSPVTKIMLSEKHLVSGEEVVTGRRIRQTVSLLIEGAGEGNRGIYKTAVQLQTVDIIPCFCSLLCTWVYTCD